MRPNKRPTSFLRDFMSNLLSSVRYVGLLALLTIVPVGEFILMLAGYLIVGAIIEVVYALVLGVATHTMDKREGRV